jgi:hypothetical protein
MSSAYNMYINIVAIVLLLTGLLAAPSMAHMNMVYPPPRGYKKLLKSSGYVDYNIMAPALDICQGKPAGPISATLTAGQTVNVQLEGGARHNGGHCQFAMSYDNGKTFVVLRTIEQRCTFDTLTYPVTIPSTAPSSDHAIFAWTWINASGNREYYMNCADVKVIGQPDGYIIGPKLLITSILGNPDVPEWGHTGKKDTVGVKMLKSRPIITVSANDIVPSTTGPTITETSIAVSAPTSTTKYKLSAEKISKYGKTKYDDCVQASDDSDHSGSTSQRCNYRGSRVWLWIMMVYSLRLCTWFM